MEINVTSSIVDNHAMVASASAGISGVCSVAVLSGLRPHEASEERESYYLSDELLDFT